MKICALVLSVLLVGIMKEKTHKKLNISLPLDLHAFCVEKKNEEQAKNPMVTVPISKIISEAVREMRDSEKKANAPASNARPSSPTFLRGKTRRQ